MNLETYKARMAEMGIDRENLEERIKPFYAVSKESAYLPGGEKRSLVPLRPPSEGDLSHLNPHPKNGRKARCRQPNGRP